MGNEFITLVVYLGIAVAAALAGAFFMRSRMQTELMAAHEDNARLRSTLEAEQRVAQERNQAYKEAREQLAESFSNLSGQALRTNNEEFLRLAQEKLKQFQLQAKSELSEREKAVESMVRPIREALTKTEEQIRLMEKERKEAYGSLHRHLETMATAQQQLQTETGNLVKALRRPEVRGRWGEMTLRRLVELAGMVEYCDFFEQTQVRDEDGAALRPDMIVRMPNGREIVVDAKTPVDAYVDAVEATDDNARRDALARHAVGVKKQVQKLAEKAYWQQFKNAPDFVVLFIPGEQFLVAAQDVDRDLMEYALRNKVILATPTTLVALLRAVAFGWRQEAVAEHAEHIRELGESLYNRLATFTEHLGKVGKSLGGAVDHYNKAVGSLERQVLPGARKFNELGVQAKKELETPSLLEKQAREPVNNGD